MSPVDTPAPPEQQRGLAHFDLPASDTPAQIARRLWSAQGVGLSAESDVHQAVPLMPTSADLAPIWTLSHVLPPGCSFLLLQSGQNTSNHSSQS